MTAASELMPEVRGGGASAWKRDRLFYSGMAILSAITVFAGFAPTYFLRSFSTQPSLKPLVHLHGAIFTAWVVLFVVQASLVATRRVALHRRLGVLGGVIAVLMVVVGTLTAVTAARSGNAPPGLPPLVFLVVPLGDLLVFATLVTSAILYRRKSEIHRRLMLLTMLALLTPAVARLPFIPGNPLAFFGATDAFILVFLIYDWVTRGRVNRALATGAAFVIVSQPLRLVLGGTAAWMTFAKWVTSL